MTASEPMNIALDSARVRRPDYLLESGWLSLREGVFGVVGLISGLERNFARAESDLRKRGPLAQSISSEILSINAFIGVNANPWRMKVTKRAAFFSLVSLSAVLASGCQTFNMSSEKFAEQQKGHYDCTAEARTVEVAGCVLYFLRPILGCRMPGPAPEL